MGHQCSYDAFITQALSSIKIFQHLLLSIPEFIGHLHPVIVHLPIGILLLACLFLWQSRKDRSEDFQRTINIILGLGMISAIAACITGFILSRIGEYEEGLAGWHQWMGISVALVSIITFYFRRKKSWSGGNP